ncbi:MAG: hypothetical protein F6K32_10940 [Desertifilum sp. SIO1I2]|nr:hypothetical protein [Desertifilum sp. SIO1I2]
MTQKDAIQRAETIVVNLQQQANAGVLFLGDEAIQVTLKRWQNHLNLLKR